MYNAETMDAVRTSAQILTESSRVLTVGNPESPLARYLDSYNIDTESTRTPVSDEMLAATEEYFEEINQEPTPLRAEENESLLDQAAKGLSVFQFNARNVIVPAIDDMARNFAERYRVITQPDLDITTYNYDAIHSAPELTNHLTRYDAVSPRAEYRTFLLAKRSAAEIIQLVAENNAHLSTEEVTSWALKIPAATIEQVWADLFSGSRALAPGQLRYVRGMDTAGSIDPLTLAYFIAGAFLDNPQEVLAEDVGLPEWEVAIQMLHEMFGFYLARAHQRRADDKQDGVVVLGSEATNAIEERRVRIVLNGDVAGPWLDAGNDVQAIIGAVLESPSNVTLATVEGKGEYFVNRWQSVYPLIKQAAQDYADRSARTEVVKAFLEVAATNEALQAVGVVDLGNLVQDAVRSLRQDDIRNPFKSFGYLICRTFYTDNVYWEFLCNMDDYSKQHPGATGRELATQALFTLIAVWLADQTVIVPYQADIAVGAVVPSAHHDDEGEPTGPEVADAVQQAVVGEVPGSEEPHEMEMTPEGAAAFHDDLQSKLDTDRATQFAEGAQAADTDPAAFGA
jgi:hypothetical protein